MGLEHLLLEGCAADSVVLAFDEEQGPFPILREPMAVGERRQLCMAWIFAPDLSVHPQPQAYTRLADRLYLFENLDGSGFSADLPWTKMASCSTTRPVPTSEGE